MNGSLYTVNRRVAGLLGSNDSKDVRNAMDGDLK